MDLSPDPPGGRPDRVVRFAHPELPPLPALMPLLQQVWDSALLTNAGPLHRQFEQALCEFLQVEQVCLFNNATTALMAALRALGGGGEVITSPFTFVATANAIRWAGFEPVFADIDPASLNLDPAKAEALVTPATVAVMPVHCFGRPCDTEGFTRLSRRHGLITLYDAAHAFGVRQQKRSLLSEGDLAVVSFHATKVFQTFEGGAVICRDARLRQRLERLRNHGLSDDATVEEPGLNGKMSELHAALGLLQLPRIATVIEGRRRIDEAYRCGLATVAGIRCLPFAPGYESNFAYFPILVDEAYPLSRDALQVRLGAQGIQTKRYFWPLVPDLPAYREQHAAHPSALPEARRVVDRVLCLPIHTHLGDPDIDRVVHAIAYPR